MADVLGRPLAVANAGVDLFADELERQGVRVDRVEWRPPEPGTEDALARLALEAAAIARANDEAVERIESAQPYLVGVGTARDLLPDIGDRTILHAGPPIDWADMSGPLRGAVIGAAVYEGLATDRDDAGRRAAAGEFEFGPCHERGAVGPMAGVVSPSMPMCVIENTTHGNRAFCTFNEGLGKVLRYGANDDTVLERLAWIRDVLARVFAKALDRLEPIDLRSAMSALTDGCGLAASSLTSFVPTSPAPVFTPLAPPTSGSPNGSGNSLCIGSRRSRQRWRPGQERQEGPQAERDGQDQSSRRILAGSNGADRRSQGGPRRFRGAVLRHG